MPRLSRIKLTKRSVETATAPDTASDRDGAFVWDSEVKGFGLRVYPSGKKVLLYQYTNPTENRTRRLVLGQFPAVTVEDARARAILAAGVVASGKDPKGEDSDELQRRTMADVFPLYLAERRAKMPDSTAEQTAETTTRRAKKTARGKKIAPRTIAEYERVWRTTVAPTFGSKLPRAITEEAVARWHTALEGTPTLANRA
jgi:hypothetical protein